MNCPAHEICPRCGCCSFVWERCDTCCGARMNGHDCGEDTCCCLDPEENETCEVCDGEGGWSMCLGRCDENGNHSSAGLGDLERTKECVLSSSK